MSSIQYQQARLSNDCTYIIDSDNQKVGLDDPRVVHIWPIAAGRHITRMLKSVFEKRGWNFRFTAESTAKGRMYAKKLCSGRECFSCLTMTGETCRDIEENRQEGEISLYYNFDSSGPCQSGAWPAVWDTFAKRLDMRNTVFMASTTLENKYMGQGDGFARDLVMSIIVGDIMEEAEASLKCLAKDRTAAIEIFEAENKKVFESARTDMKAVESSLEQWAETLAGIPLTALIEKTPRVLVFGGMAVMFFHHEISDYFIEQGIIPKVEELSVGLKFIQGRHVVRYGLKRGLTDPEDQFKTKGIFLSLLNPFNNFGMGRKALKARVNVAGIDYFGKRFRKTARKSGLLFFRPSPYMDMINKGHAFASYSTDNETPLLAGLCECAIGKGDIDGLVNATYFTCMPNLNAQGFERSLASANDFPFAAIDCDSPTLSANHRRLLESVAVQARRMRASRASS